MKVVLRLKQKPIQIDQYKNNHVNKKILEKIQDISGYSNSLLLALESTYSIQPIIHNQQITQSKVKNCLGRESPIDKALSMMINTPLCRLSGWLVANHSRIMQRCNGVAIKIIFVVLYKFS